MFDQIKSNVQSGVPGQRGELLLAAQIAVMLGIAGGDVPLVGSLLRADVGILTMGLGAASILLGVAELGPQLSPYATVAEVKGGSSLRTQGAYSIVRHPMYTGLILCGAGFSVATDSITRLALTGALCVILARKADLEEKELSQRFGDKFVEWKEEVKHALIPGVY